VSSEHSDAGIEALAETASMVAHELRNPIAAIRGLTATATRMYERLSDEERREFLAMIEQEARRLSRIAETASTALKLSAGSLRFDPRPASLSKLVRDVVEETATGDHPLVVETGEGVEAAFDEGRIGEAVGHVVDNAARFSPPDAPIEVRVFAEGAGLVIEVGDGGPGIPPERREEVFDRFARHRPAGYEEVGGSGLGLHIARAHVEEHGGRITIEDRPDGGTILRIVLPATREAT